MRKVLLVLTVLAMTAPCWAAVSVSCSYVGETVTVSYNCTGDANDIRAFGIQVDVNNGATISNIDVNDADYYIFPGSIDINSLGGVESWGSAVADQTSTSFILEMGSLYDPCDPVHKTVPPKSGTLCTFDVATPLTGCTVSLSKDTARGGVVMEDGNEYAALSGVTMPYGGCYPAGMADWSTWDDVNRPPSWCYPRQCHGDADNAQDGDIKVGFFYVWSSDFNVLSAGWKQPYSGDPTVDTWIAADFDHDVDGDIKTGYFRVWSSDFNILSANWKSNPDPNCLEVP